MPKESSTQSLCRYNRLEKMNGYTAQTGIHLEGIELRVGR
jgi:hypothetical protein